MGLLSADKALDAFQTVKKMRDTERMDTIHSYVSPERGTQPSWLPAGSPQELKRLAKVCKVNVCGFILRSATQSLYVDGYHLDPDAAEVDPEVDDTDGGVEASPGWMTWRRNHMPARQVGLHRAGLKYGTSYKVVLPGDPVPVMRPVSPRDLTAAYADDPRWPMYALEDAGGGMWKLYDELAIYTFREAKDGKVEFITHDEHRAGRCPVVRYQPDDDLDGDHTGIVWPILDLQDQLDLTTFSLKVAEHYGAHRQRYIIGWMAESELKALQTAASKLWQFEQEIDDDGNWRDIKVGEFEQTKLDGYLESREATLRHIATIAQTPVHELTGSLINLAAEALVAARDSNERMLTQVRALYGASHEQSIGFASSLVGGGWDPLAVVRWRDMAGRSLSQSADALGKFVEMLKVPPEAVWEMIPGVDQSTIRRWKKMARQGDHLGAYVEFLNMDRTSANEPAGDDAPATTAA